MPAASDAHIDERIDSSRGPEGGQMAVQSLQDLYMNKLQLIYDAELQALDAYPQLVAHIEHSPLRQAVETHVEQTREQVQKLEQLFASAGLQGGQRGQCLSMRALL